MSAKSAAQHDTLELDGLSPFESLGKSVSKAIDPFGVTTSLLSAQMAWLMHPQELVRAVNALSGDLLALQAHVTRRALGIPSDDVIQPNADDARFANPIWTDSASWDIAKEWYLAFTHRLQDMYFETPGLSDKERRRAAFWLRKWLNMVAPTNFFWTNPVALERAVATQGESLRRGWENFQRDAKAKNIQMVEPDAFTVGKDLATTPGKVVFRNRLVELIHYTPTTDKVRAMPIVIVTPWINKFYILDLNAKKSLVKYLTDQGFSVFITSWKNPDADMRDVRFDDYLLEGVNEVVRVAGEFCKQPKVHLVGYCIGGTLVSTYMAWANKRFGEDQVPVAHWTLFTTLTDFSNPGDIDVFIDDACISALEESMAKKGYLDGNEMATSFRLLRSNSLVWSYWVNSYLLGEPLPPFDVLFWNVDSTRMPQAMHAWYLRELYLNNKLIKRDSLTVAGEPIDLDRIVQPLYAVTAEDDHIAPWKQCYRIRKYVNVKAPVRFVLSTSGHILGIVNPPVNPPKRAYWIAEPERNEHWEQWQERAEKKPGTWWEDWTAWLGERSGELVEAYPATNRKFPGLADAPGTYVLEK
ncbi:PHA/PHB synthase family protein [Azonexus hydrophilus]|uniref:PHA/PHB synthase family protein n=1 Tax=Azonexus hydrophilus TaxID=418702 RepID=UPI0003F4C913|nr:alpha/beta fold hydrolase [Azonexus hydrophilus]